MGTVGATATLTDEKASTGVAPRAAGEGKTAPRRIAALARSCDSTVRYFRDLLPILGEELGAFFVGVHLQLPTEVWTRDWNDGTVPPTFWKPAVEDTLTEALAETGAHARLFRSRDGGDRIAILTTPIYDSHGARLGAVAALQRTNRDELEQDLESLQTIVHFACECTCFLDSTTEEERSTGAETSTQRALQRAGNFESPMELAYAVANQLQSKSGADLVALGEVRGRRVRMRVISGQDEVKHNAPGVILIRQALEECLDRGEPVVSQSNHDWNPDGAKEDHRLHRQWHEASGGDAVVSFPLKVGPDARYIVGLRRGREVPFNDNEVDKLRELVEPYAPALELLRRAHRRLPVHAIDDVRTKFEELIGPGRIGRKVAAFAFLWGIVWFIFGTTEYEITVPARVLPAESRIFSAPEDGVLRILNFEPGDRVEAGEILCSFDDRQLQLEGNRVRAELSASEVDLHRSLAEDDRVGARLAQMKIAELQALLEINDLRIAATVVRAPFAGDVTDGDLRERVGDQFAKGESLLELASEGGWRLVLDVPESRLNGVGPGLSGAFASFARPEDSQEFTLAEIAPSTTPDAGRNVFKVRAELGAHPKWMRAGMEGVARVEIGPRRASWVMLHEVFDWFHLNYWF